MPVKNGGESDAEGDVSGAESEHSNSSQGHESSDEEANEIDSDDSSEMDANEIERRRNECLEILGMLNKLYIDGDSFFYDCIPVNCLCL